MTAKNAMNVLIVDDEALARLRIRRFLEKEHPDWTLREAQDGFEALAAIADETPGLVFLDVEMPELTGFDVLHELAERTFPVIFQTAYDLFAVKAFDANAVDYLLKPFTDERLAQALAKVAKRPATPTAPELDDLEKELRGTARGMTKLVINAGPRQKIVDVGEVSYFSSESHVTRVFLVNGQDYAYGQSLTHLEERLDPAAFIRIHRNAIVRIDAIVAVERGPRAELSLRSGVKLAVSRERRKALSRVLGGADEDGKED